MPTFIGGDTALVSFLNKHVRWPNNLPITVRGKVYVRFLVDTKGNVRDIAVVRSLHPVADAEAVRATQLLSGHFTPGTDSNHQPIDFLYTLPIFFNP
ncbi:energy transducer TonB [Hymenobacter swuensis]|uniref:energy transducer TonB n=1 Tax=Hymenobacter swuensis TaxID=1446467 RepID=UPI00373FE37A